MPGMHFGRETFPQTRIKRQNWGETRMLKNQVHPGNGKSIQDYIDEAPVWLDGTRLQRAPMTAMQGRIWTLAVAGKFFEGWSSS